MTSLPPGFREGGAAVVALSCVLSITLLSFMGIPVPDIIPFTLTAAMGFLFGHTSGVNGVKPANPTPSAS